MSSDVLGRKRQCTAGRNISSENSEMRIGFKKKSDSHFIHSGFLHVTQGTHFVLVFSLFIKCTLIL